MYDSYKKLGGNRGLNIIVFQLKIGINLLMEQMVLHLSISYQLQTKQIS